jgi:hypothetical protein
MSDSVWWHVYALKDPRTNEVRYIGTTTDLKTRMASHFTSRIGRKRCAWFEELRQLKIKPLLEVLESGGGEPEDQARAECKWIEHYKPSGLLVNSIRGGGTLRTKINYRLYPHLAPLSTDEIIREFEEKGMLNRFPDPINIAIHPEEWVGAA